MRFSYGRVAFFEDFGRMLEPFAGSGAAPGRLLGGSGQALGGF